jgi:hypothetical protein
MANILFSILSTFNDKGLKKASKQVSLFEKQTKSLQATFLKTFSALALINYSKKAVQAFAADEAAAKSLETQLKNTGFAFSAPGVENYIAGLQNLYGVLDDQLRPAFQQLLTATGSITRSQDALEVALNVSAATGKSLTEVSAALTRGFSGNTAGLSRLGSGISKATLKSGDMNKIMEELNAKFAGQAAAKLDTYAGKMGLLRVASADAAEIIGKGLLDALTVLGKDTSISDTTKKIEGLATAISNLIVGLGVLGSKLSDIGSSTGLNKIISFLYQGTPVDLLIKAGAGARTTQLPANQQRSAGRISAKQFQTEDKLTKAKALELALLLKKNAIENKNVEELRKKFDIERIGLTAALNAATDEETKLKLRSLLAILDNNDAMAKKLIAELEAAEALKKLAEQAKLAGMSIEEFGIFKVKTLSNKIDTYIEDLALSTIRELNARIAATLAKFNFTSPAAAAPSTQMFTGPSGATYTAPQVQAAILDTRELNSRINDFLSGFSTGGVQRSSSQEPMQIKVTVDAGGDRLSQAIAESIQVATRSGYSTVPAGFIA